MYRAHCRAEVSEITEGWVNIRFNRLRLDMTSPAYDLSDERLTVQQCLAEGHSPGVPVDGNAERASDSELG